MRKSILIATLAAALASASLGTAGAEAAALAPEPQTGLIVGVDHPGDAATLQTVQYVWGGRNYCWYGGGWRGPGYYWCGYAWRRGFGWGGGVGWHGWARGHYVHPDWRHGHRWRHRHWRR